MRKAKTNPLVWGQQRQRRRPGRMTGPHRGLFGVGEPIWHAAAATGAYAVYPMYDECWDQRFLGYQVVHKPRGMNSRTDVRIVQNLVTDLDVAKSVAQRDHDAGGDHDLR
jgi:hypothetical protein